MSTLLGEALAQLDLEPGQSYRTAVEGYEVEVRVLGRVAEKTSEEAALHADGRMLDPWFAIPDPPTAMTVIASAGEPLPFDRPDIPHEEMDEYATF